MNTHKNARLTYVRRIEMIQDITQRGLSVPQGAAAQVARKPAGRQQRHASTLRGGFGHR